ncbi:ribonuclease III [bacterium (Candidatus Gribaldobacteria) CG23_combo_of_CG06-09_8_20_14_all_37_87_8]|uniref:Ribonuclease 3 n=2 Tax=Candidatus Gribaldobacteria TaxID=2798536 RepID=A0A2G9ZHG6_9BACT|nr:MAG: ribonuclease III [Parcubacteria group bacterium CG1_02_37_13]PIP31788.1 MAG: ribonuclease III [bacterium (Candidatus Gribaldobacteria) CG23_combo_of_CG06-09_8_20_14_all_37_87_8]PIR90391.1 MAG: ribonuclease III [bacterium (Candidatus Gribaldobacteria) CG10_big_fil_rev_8_21_14_0_10_37_21]
MKDFSELEQKLNISFKNKKLLQQAFCHRSYLNENPSFPLDHNERLEFLGDAVLELAVTEYLYNKYPNPEGEMTNWRAALVNSQSLAKLAGELDFSEFLLLSKGEAKDRGKARQYILANTLEAFLGAFYLDQGFEKPREFIEKHLIKGLPQILKEGSYKDAKSLFQEKSQEKVSITPSYRVVKEWGPDHAKSFVVGVYLDKEKVAEGEGSSKQEAEVAAAQNGLEAKNWN